MQVSFYSILVKHFIIWHAYIDIRQQVYTTVKKFPDERCWKTLVEKLIYIFIFLNIASHSTFETEKNQPVYMFIYLYLNIFNQTSIYLFTFSQPTKTTWRGKKNRRFGIVWCAIDGQKIAHNNCPCAPLLSANTIHSGPTVLVGPPNVCNSHTNGAWRRIVRRNSFIPRLSLVLRRSATIVGTTAKEAAKQMEKGNRRQRGCGTFCNDFSATYYFVGH